MKVHDLKCHPESFQAVRRGFKRYEIRVNDRDYRVGDILRLREWDPDCGGYYTSSDAMEFYVAYLTPGGSFGVPDNMVVMSLKEMPF